MVKKIDIEFNGYCNRNCEWCSNSVVNRKKDFFRMDFDAFKKLILELKNTDENGFKISFSRYNEPLAKVEDLKKYVDFTKEQLGTRCAIILNSNGDFLENFKGLNVDRLDVMDYDGLGKTKVIEKIIALGGTITKEDDKTLWFKLDGVSCKYEIEWTKNVLIEDRAGIIKEVSKVEFKKNADGSLERKEPCLYPSSQVSIDYNGNVMPCCHMRSDIEEHEEFIMGNIVNQELTEILKSKKFQEFKSNVASKKFPNPCKNCLK